MITHARDSAAKFLGYEITTMQSDTKQTRDKNGHKGRKVNGAIGLQVPEAVVEDKCKRYMRKGTSPSIEQNCSMKVTLPSSPRISLNIGGWSTTTSMAYNLHTLQKLKWVMETSLAKTLSPQTQNIGDQDLRQVQTEIEVEGKKYKVLQVTVPREGKKPLVATWGGIPLTWDASAPIEDQIQQHQWKRSELEKRLLAQVCEQCESNPHDR